VYYFAITKDNEKLSHHMTLLDRLSDARVQFSIVYRKRIWTVQKVVLKHHDYFVSPNRMHKRRASKLYTRDFRSLWKNLRDKFRCLILLHIDEGPTKVMPMQSDYEATIVYSIMQINPSFKKY